jgi:hypothetical protein
MENDPKNDETTPGTTPSPSPTPAPQDARKAALVARFKGKRGRGGAKPGNINRMTHGFHAKRLREGDKETYAAAFRRIYGDQGDEFMLASEAALVVALQARAIAAHPDVTQDPAAMEGVRAPGGNHREAARRTRQAPRPA